MVNMELKEKQGLYISKSGLKYRGWTDKAISTFLPTHDKEAKNPHYSKSPPMRLYLITRVSDVEQTDAYKQFTEGNKSRVIGAAKATSTKKNRLLNEVSMWDISLKCKPVEVVIQDAIRSYNNFHEELLSERGHDYTEASPSSGVEFLNRITVNYIRHNLSYYDEKLERLFGKVGKMEAYIILNKKIYAKIGDIYPVLSEECKRQLDRKLGGV